MPQCISMVTFRQGKALISSPCGKCNYCLQNRRNDWTFRLMEELKEACTAHFLTYTYDDKHQPKTEIVDPETGELYALPTLDKTDMQKFFKRLRKANDRDTWRHPDRPSWPSIKYYTVGEYGGETFRPHYHSIIFNIKPPTLNRISQLWDAGHVTVGQVEPASIHYVTKYVLNKNDGWEPIAPPFSLISGGLGKGYLATNGHQHKKAQQNFVINDLGAKQRIPRYYADKIFSIREREALRELGTAQHDVLYKENIAKLQKLYAQPENYHDYLKGYMHDKIKQKKSSINPNSI